MRHYRDERKSKESLESYIHRLQQGYSNPAIGFMIRWNRQMRRHGEKLFLSCPHPYGSHNESDEIYQFGIQLIHQLIGYNPYESEAALFEGRKGFKFETRQLNEFIRPYAPIIEKMAEPTPKKRYDVFSEIIVAFKEIETYE